MSKISVLLLYLVYPKKSNKLIITHYSIYYIELKINVNTNDRFCYMYLLTCYRNPRICLNQISNFKLINSFS